MHIMTHERMLAGLGLVVAFFVPAWWGEIIIVAGSAANWMIDTYTVIYIEGGLLASACVALVGFK